jgi:hypothetical protein
MINTKSIAAIIWERKKAGDHRSSRDILSELMTTVSEQDRRQAVQSDILTKFKRLLRKNCLATNGKRSDENQNPLPFDPQENSTLSYRVATLVRVRRESGEDVFQPDHVKGEEITKFDAWDLAQRRRLTAYTQDRQRHNLSVSQNLAALLGLDPKAHTVGEMRAMLENRICALCGDGHIEGDPWEQDHETPVSSEVTGTAVRWTHRSCNRSKGKLDLPHIFA